ncbi:EAL domain-containing protein [Methylobacterium sp. E-046]|nr:EAL domain-containing protein [Methylobacterium sp. E-046]
MLFLDRRREGRSGLSRVLRAAALAAGIAIPATLTYTLTREHAQALADAEQRAANTARTLAQHAERTFETVDTYLRAVSSLVGAREVGVPTQALHAALREQFARTRLTNIMVIDRDGQSIVEAVAFPPRPLDVHDRDYFQALRDHSSSGLVVGQPITGRLSNKLLLPVARRIDNPDGSFAGVVQALIDPEAFRGVYDGIDNGPDSAVSLWRVDGTMLVRAPWAPEMIGRNYATGSNYRLHVPIRDERPFWSPATTDAIERVFAFGFLDGYPIYVSAAIARASALAGWHKSAVAQGGVAGGLTAVLVTALLLLARELERRQTADERTRASEARLRASEERLALALDAGSDGLWDCDLATGAAWSSDRWWRMLGYEPGELGSHAHTWRVLLHPEDAPHAERALTEHLEGRAAAYECEHRLRRKDGGWAWVLTRGRVVARGLDGAPLRFVGTQIDISARKAAEGQIAHMARHDALTDLPNRALFQERLAHKLAEVHRYGGSCAVMSLDLDKFKLVNDTLGHPAGDALLREVAERLRSALRVEDTVARLGGDEFAVLLAGADEPVSVGLLAEHLIAAVRAPFPFGDQRMEVGLSVGTALAPIHGLDGEALFKRADLALYRAKAEGRNTHRVYEAAMDEAAAERRTLECDLHRAIEGGELTLHYQPQVTTEGGELVGFEALVRWRHPERGLLPPGAFISLAEETGLILPLGEWVLRAACREAARWERPLKVAVNLSPRQFQQADLPERVLAVLTETSLSPTRLELEVTESVLINDKARALGILRRLKAFGVSISMDDFGTGYSSLATLQAFPFDRIKIDRSFVGNVEESPQAAAIVRAVLGLGRSLGMGVVAEGVETTAQMRFLVSEACDEVQGYLVGKPQPIERFADAVRTGAIAASSGAATAA